MGPWDRVDKMVPHRDRRGLRHHLRRHHLHHHLKGQHRSTKPQRVAESVQAVALAHPGQGRVLVLVQGLAPVRGQVMGLVADLCGHGRRHRQGNCALISISMDPWTSS